MAAKAVVGKKISRAQAHAGSSPAVRTSFLGEVVFNFDYHDIENDFVFHYGVEKNTLSVHTLANSLDSLSHALEIISGIVEPGSDLHIKVVAVGPGSFRIQLTPELKKFFKDSAIRVTEGVIIGLLVFVLASKLSDGESTKNITINGDVVINANDSEIILPGSVEAVIDRAINDENLDEQISNSFKEIGNDPEVRNFGIANSISDEHPQFLVDREFFSRLSMRREREEKSRIHPERITVRIVRAILEVGIRKWQFSYSDGKFSAPVLDIEFLEKLRSHEIMLGIGDYLDITLLKKQEWDDVIGT